MKDERQPVINLEAKPGKVVGRRRPPANGLSLDCSNTIEGARAWQRVLPSGIPKGVYRFRTHEEADALFGPRHS